MQELLEAIRVAVTEGATAEQKSIGAQACRTILAALDAQPGKPIVLPGAAPLRPLAAMSIDQVLDLAIARLIPIAEARDSALAPSGPGPAAAPPRPGLRVPMSPARPAAGPSAARKR